MKRSFLGKLNSDAYPSEFWLPPAEKAATEVEMTLTQKERSLLQDLRNEEQLCSEKYRQYAAGASDGALKNIFQGFYGTELDHLNRLDGYLGTAAQSGAQNMQQNNSQQSNPYSSGRVDYNSGSPVSGGFSSAASHPNQASAGDDFFCSDCLTLEKHLSSLYDTCVFECTDQELRNTLGTMQKDVQQQGKQLWDYMSSHGMNQN